MAKTYVGVADKYLPYVRESGVKSSMLSTGTYYFATEVEDNRDSTTNRLTYTIPCKVAKLGSEAIGMYTDNTSGQTNSTTVAGNWYVKVTGVSSDGYLIVDIYDSKLTGVAHKVKKMYVGVDGVAKKVRKAYVGVNGVARKIFSGNELEGYTWTQIAEIAKSGSASNVFSIGDTKLMSLGYAPTGSLKWYTATIIGFDHDDAAYMSDEGYPREKAGITFMVTPLYYTSTMGPTDGSGDDGFWLYSQTYLHWILNNYNFDYDDGREENYYGELGPLFIKVRKYTRGKYSQLDTREDNCIATLFIPSEWEIFGSSPNSMDGDSTNPKEQYQYFKEGGSTRLYDEEGNPATWWLRSDTGVKDLRCYVGTDGTVKTGDKFAADYAAWCFCL